MKGVDLAEMLQELLEAKINKYRGKMLDNHMPIEVERLQAQIMAYQWVQGRLQDMCGRVYSIETIFLVDYVKKTAATLVFRMYFHNNTKYWTLDLCMC
jgi:hypothetical protein